MSPIFWVQQILLNQQETHTNQVIQCDLFISQLEVT